MNIALMAHDNKKELMVQFCTAYSGILSRHTLCATSATNTATAEMLIMGLDRGDLDWRDIVNPKTKPFTT